MRSELAHASAVVSELKRANCFRVVHVGGGSMISCARQLGNRVVRGHPQQSGRFILVVPRLLANRHLNQKESRIVAARLDLRRHPVCKRHEGVRVHYDAGFLTQFANGCLPKHLLTQRCQVAETG